MSNLTVEFLNPDNLPVEALTLSVTNAGVVQQINALDSYWVEKREFILYERTPSGTNFVVGALDAWKRKMELYRDDLKWLLSLDYHRFWSTILFHTECMDFLVSFLQEADPPYLPPNENKDVRILYEDIRKHLLIVFSRLITNKESKIHWMSKEYLAGVIYNKFIFTIPIIWDLCLTYGADNLHHISHLVTSVFTVQPQYEVDVEAAMAFVKEVLKYIVLQVNKSYDTDDPPNLPETFQGFSEIKRPSTSNQAIDKLTFPILRDLVIHLVDTAMTIRIFVQAYPKCVGILEKTNFVLSIVQLYEYGIPELYEKLQQLGDETSISYTEVEGYIDVARAELVDIFKEILAVYKNWIFSDSGNIATHVENYLSVMMDCLSERLMIKDYHAMCAVHEDIEMLKQAYPEIDSVKTDFILQAIYSNLDEPIPENLLSTNNHSHTNGHTETNGEIDEPPPKDNEIPDDIREESLISEVKDILPHLGDGFILKCLHHYGFNAERVINSVLEDNLAESLRGLDRNLPIIPPDPVDTKFLETGIQRLNVFDGDQFDILTRDDVDLSRIHIGKKKSKYKDLKDMLDDKTEVKQLKDIYMKYDVICDEEGMYSDEYDDTYDVEDVTAHIQESSSEESEPEPEPEPKPSSSSTSRNRVDFCVNPEELRARRQAAYIARGRGATRGHYTRPTADVTGKPKGQGQDKEVLINRERKEKHKSSRGNHNRRQGAQWKRSQGMMPS